MSTLIFNSTRIPGSILVKAPAFGGVKGVVTKVRKGPDMGKHTLIMVGDPANPVYNLLAHLKPMKYDDLKEEIIRVHAQLVTQQTAVS